LRAAIESHESQDTDPLPFCQVPLLSHDVHGLTTLAEIADALTA
jgi:hypothetical protein